MAWYATTVLETSLMEQIETAVCDLTLSPEQRQRLLIYLWARLEAAHGSRVFSFVSPEGMLIERPLRPRP